MGSVKDLVVERKPGEIMMGRGEFDFSDRYSVFDWGEMPDHITSKGAALCTMSAYFFEKLASVGMKTHYGGVEGGGRYGPLGDAQKPPTKMRVSLVRVLKPVTAETDGMLSYDYAAVRDAAGKCVIPLEVMYRNSLPKGSSVFRRLKNGSITLQEMGLTEQPFEGQKLPQPFVDGSTKYEEFDRYPGWQELQNIAGLGDDELAEVRRLTVEADNVLTRELRAAGLENEDGKFEYAFTPARSLMIVDTVGTLDECRITYNGVDVSKQIPRDWYAYSQPEWKAEIDSAKARNKKDWKSFVTARPEPLPQALKEIMEALYISVANRVIDREIFSGAAPIDKVLAEYQRFKAAEMK